MLKAVYLYCINELGLLYYLIDNCLAPRLLGISNTRELNLPCGYRSPGHDSLDVPGPGGNGHGVPDLHNQPLNVAPKPGQPGVCVLHSDQGILGGVDIALRHRPDSDWESATVLIGNVAPIRLVKEGLDAQL